MTAEYSVWWVPQVPMKAFRVNVPDYATGALLCDVLAAYDRFQFENRVKPDYCNAGGVDWRHPEHTDGEWHSIEDADEAGEIAALLNGEAA